MTEDKTVYEKVIKEVTQELFYGGGPLQPFAERIMKLKMDEIVNEGNLAHLDPNYNKTGELPKEYKEWLIAKFTEDLPTLLESLYKFPEVRSSLYNKNYEGLKASGHKNWTDLLSEIFKDDSSLSEIFVRLVEEQEGVEITSAKQLQELTGIKELWGDEGEVELTKKQREEKAKSQIAELFIQAMSYRYSNTLEGMIQAGAKYKDLLLIKPKDFNLPETWSGGLASDQYSSILWAIEDVFRLGEPNSSVRPDLKTVAKEIEAPYSVLMDAHKICNKWKLQS